MSSDNKNTPPPGFFAELWAGFVLEFLRRALGFGRLLLGFGSLDLVFGFVCGFRRLLVFVLGVFFLRELFVFPGFCGFFDDFAGFLLRIGF